MRAAAVPCVDAVRRPIIGPYQESTRGKVFTNTFSHGGVGRAGQDDTRVQERPCAVGELAAERTERREEPVAGLGQEPALRHWDQAEFREWMHIEDQAANRAGVFHAIEQLQAVNRRLDVDMGPATEQIISVILNKNTAHAEGF